MQSTLKMTPTQNPMDSQSNKAENQPNPSEGIILRDLDRLDRWVERDNKEDFPVTALTIATITLSFYKNDLHGMHIWNLTSEAWFIFFIDTFFGWLILFAGVYLLLRLARYVIANTLHLIAWPLDNLPLNASTPLWVGLKLLLFWYFFSGTSTIVNFYLSMSLD